MTSPPTHTLGNGLNFASQNHLTLGSTPVFSSQTTGQSLRSGGLNLERLGLPDGVHGPSQQGSSSANGTLQTKVKSHPHGKKTKGRVKIKMEFIDNKLRRYTTFSKRKAGLMKKAYELSTLTGTEVMLLVASETGHVYTFATTKLQPMIASDDGKKLIQTCLNSNLPNGCQSGLDEPLEHRMNLVDGYDEEAGDEDDMYFDDDGDSSNDSPPPGNARFHHPNSSVTSSASRQPSEAHHGPYSQAEYGGGAAGDSYDVSSYSSYDSDPKSTAETAGSDLNGYDLANRPGNFNPAVESGRR